MSFLDLTKKLDELKRDYKQQSMDLSKGYVVGSEVHKLAQAKLEENYQNSKTAILTQINRKLVKMEEKAKLEQEVHQKGAPAERPVPVCLRGYADRFHLRLVYRQRDLRR